MQISRALYQKANTQSCVLSYLILHIAKRGESTRVGGEDLGHIFNFFWELHAEDSVEDSD